MYLLEKLIICEIKIFVKGKKMVDCESFRCVKLKMFVFIYYLYIFYNYSNIVEFVVVFSVYEICNLEIMFFFEFF